VVGKLRQQASVESGQRYQLLRPDPAGTIRSLASLGYSPQAAIADLVDNSIAAGAASVDVTCRWSGSESWIRVVDNGRGMDETALLRGLTVGGRALDTRDGQDLGRFGMGLKTASFSQARVLVVSSRPMDGVWTTRTWDTDHVISVGDWELLAGCPSEADDPLAEAQRDLPNGGTVVLWLQLTRLTTNDAATGDEAAQKEFYRHVNAIEAHLGMVFSRYIADRKKLGITLDGQPVVRWDPFLTGVKYVEELPSETPLPGVKVQGFVMPHRSRLTEERFKTYGGPRGWLDQQGFYVYRRDRLIVAGDWLGIGGFRKDEKHVLARISVELPPEQDRDWALDVKKSTAMPPPALAGHLRRIAKATRERASSVMNHRGRVVRDRQTESVDFTWRVAKQFGQTRFLINREHPLVREIFDRHPDAKGEVATLIQMIEATLPVGVIRSTTDTAELAHDSDKGAMDVPDDILEMARRMMEVLMNKGETVAHALARVTRMPPFMDFPALAETLTGLEGIDDDDVR
jgi:hypothetical protein